MSGESIPSRRTANSLRQKQAVLCSPPRNWARAAKTGDAERFKGHEVGEVRTEQVET